MPAARVRRVPPRSVRPVLRAVADAAASRAWSAGARVLPEVLAPVQHPRRERQHRRDRAHGLHPARPPAGGRRSRRRTSTSDAGAARRRARAEPMDRELLLEIGCEELPASWLPGLTNQLGERRRRAAARAAAAARSAGRDLQHAAPADRPRRARSPSGRRSRRDWSPARRCRPRSTPDGTPTPAALGFAREAGRRRSRRSSASQTPKGEYLAFRKRQRGKSAVDVLPDVLGGMLRDLTFPEADALGRDARRRPRRAAVRPADPLAAVPLRRPRRAVHDRRARRRRRAARCRTSTSGAVTYGHRFLTTSGRAGRVDQGAQRSTSTARGCSRTSSSSSAPSGTTRSRASSTRKAQRLQGRVSRTVHSDIGAARGSADLVEYPVGRRRHVRAASSSSCREEVLTTTLIHHQHYFPVDDEDGKLKNAFLAVINTEPDNERTIARTPSAWSRRGCATRGSSGKRIARSTLESRLDRLARCCSTRSSAATGRRPSGSSAGAVDRRGGARRSRPTRPHAATAGAAGQGRPRRPTWSASSPSCRARWAASTRARKGCPRQVWKAIYFHYLPIGVEADAPPTRGAARRGGGHLGGRVARRQARHDRSAVRGRREADRLARSVRAAPRSAGRRAHPGGSAGADRASIARSGSGARRARAAHARDSTGGRGRDEAAQAVVAFAHRARPLRARAARLRRAKSCGRDAAAGDVSPLRARRVAEALQAHARVGGLPGAGGAVQAREEHRARS